MLKVYSETVEAGENYQAEKGDVQEKIKAFSHENKEQAQSKKKHKKKGKKAKKQLDIGNVEIN